MTKDEFIRLCIACGYASKKNAHKYAEGKEVFTETDFEAVHSINERNLHIENRRYYRSRAVDPDKLLDELDDRPTPWNRIYHPHTEVLREGRIVDEKRR